MKIDYFKTKIRFDLEGFEQLWALKGMVEVQKSSVESVAWHDVFTDWQPFYFRLPGTYFPGVLMAGSYYSKQGWDFVYAMRPHGWWKPFVYGVLEIKTKDKRYRRILLTMRQEEAKPIIDWFRSSSQ